MRIRVAQADSLPFRRLAVGERGIVKAVNLAVLVSGKKYEE